MIQATHAIRQSNSQHVGYRFQASHEVLESLIAQSSNSNTALKPDEQAVKTRANLVRKPIWLLHDRSISMTVLLEYMTL